MTRKVSRRRDGRKGLARLVFVTGTDTGVGKTLVTALLLHHLRQRGCHALAMKPFCSGGTQDVDLLHRLQQGELSRREINPFYFAEPVAPLVAARRRRRRISAGDVLRRIRAVQRRCGCLLIEGAGGLMAPLGAGDDRDAVAVGRLEGFQNHAHAGGIDGDRLFREDVLACVNGLM